MAKAKKPVFYTGGGVINSGPKASQLLRELVRATGFPVTSTLMGLGAYPAHEKHWLGMLGMHGTYEANMAMHDCDVMIALAPGLMTGLQDGWMRSRRGRSVFTSTSILHQSTRMCGLMCQSSVMPRT